MIRLRKIELVSLAISLMLAASNAAQATEAGKIYIDGKWYEARNTEEKSIWNMNAFFGKVASTNLGSLANRFIDENAQLLKAHTGIELSVKSTQNGNEFQTIRMEKTWNGIQVLGGETLLQVAGDRVVLANADATNLDGISVTPSLSADAAKSIAFASYQGNAQVAENPALKILVKNSNAGKVAHLVYEVIVRDRDGFSSDIHYIDAHGGEEVMATTNVQTVANRKILAGLGTQEDYNVFEDNNPPEPDTFWKTIFSDAGCSSNNLDNAGFDLSKLVSARKKDPKTVVGGYATPAPCNSVNAGVLEAGTNAWNNASVVYAYYSSVHNRDSIDDKGMVIKSVVNFGPNFSNAAWVNDKSLMIYGAGDGAELNDFAKALDVAGHELTHGVTARTAGLIYSDESGALNESYSDVFGKLVEYSSNPNADWKLGKDLFKNGTGFIRDMENPEVGHVRDKKYAGQPCSRWNDFCGVHTNSGIPNKVAVMLSKEIGLEKLGKLYYLTLTQLLRSGSNFTEARAQTLAACSTLFGSGSECTAVAAAYEKVGITQ